MKSVAVHWAKCLDCLDDCMTVNISGRIYWMEEHIRKTGHTSIVFGELKREPKTVMETGEET